MIDPQPPPPRSRSPGKLHVFLGFAPGVGKTCAMLASAHEKASRGVEVAIGFVETHGRPETQALVEGLERIPPRLVQCPGHVIKELDVAAAIARRPGTLLVDELAHRNATGGLHGRRFQDVEEVLAAGIDVLTTLNVQHLEGLNDVIAQVTGVRIHETVPDSLLELADAVELVDLPPDDLLERLRAGKIVVNEQAQRAVAAFYRKQNLVALRDLAFRSTASLVEKQVAATTSPRTFHDERLLVCVSPSPESPVAVRAAHEMATGLGARWYAVFVGRPHAPLSELEEAALGRTFALARSLGAKIVRVEGTSFAGAVVDFARREKVTRIVAGKPTHSRWVDAMFGSQLDELVRTSGNIDIVLVGSALESPAKRGAPTTIETVGSAKRHA